MCLRDRSLLHTCWSRYVDLPGCESTQERARRSGARGVAPARSSGIGSRGCGARTGREPSEIELLGIVHGVARANAESLRGALEQLHRVQRKWPRELPRANRWCSGFSHGPSTPCSGNHGDGIGLVPQVAVGGGDWRCELALELDFGSNVVVRPRHKRGDDVVPMAAEPQRRCLTGPIRDRQLSELMAKVLAEVAGLETRKGDAELEIDELPRIDRS